MKMRLYQLVGIATLLMVPAALAQAPAGAPAGSTGMCRDGSYTTNATKKGACKGHHGVKAWYAAETSSKPAKESHSSHMKQTSAQAEAPAPAPAPAPAQPSHSKASHESLSNKPAAPGGGPGMVWLNTGSNVYHCQGSRYYGKTKEGSYMTEAQAKAKGAHAEHGKPCS